VSAGPGDASRRPRSARTRPAAGARRTRRGPGLATWLALAFLVLPLLEILVIIQVGQVIGGWPTLFLLVAESALGAVIVRKEGLSAWRQLRGALGAGHLPSRELADAALVLFGGTLLLTPGFLTDAVGFVCVLPPTRPLARALLARALRGRVALLAPRTVGWGPRPGGAGEAGGMFGTGPGQATGGSQGPGASPRRVVPGEVVDGGPGDGREDPGPGPSGGALPAQR
jgi:UPF0716 protein FxsA